MPKIFGDFEIQMDTRELEELEIRKQAETV